MHVNRAHTNAAGCDRDGVQAGNAFFHARLLYACTGVFVAFFVLFALLRTKNILAVDGGIRCLEVYRRQSLYFDINNHLLQPAHVWAWTRAAGMLGHKVDSPFQFYSLVQLMNCFAGAACLAILFALMYSVVSSWRLALAVTIGYGFTKAFLEQATNANEAPMGLFWSFLALFFAALCFRVKSNWPVVVSAMIFALAMATYQTMILLFPAAIVLIWTSRSAKAVDSHANQKSGRTGLAPELRAFAIFALVGVATTACIFGLAYWTMQIRSPLAMVKAFFTHEEANVYFGITGGKVLNLPVGLTRNILPLAKDYSGIRNLLAGPPLTVALFFLTMVLLAAFFVACLLYLWNQRLRMTPCVRSAFVGATVGLLFTAVPLAIWDPNYDKFWLQPLACLAFLIVLAFHVMGAESDSVALASRIGGGILLSRHTFQLRLGGTGSRAGEFGIASGAACGRDCWQGIVRCRRLGRSIASVRGILGSRWRVLRLLPRRFFPRSSRQR